MLHTLCTPKLHSCIVARCGLLRVLRVLCKVNMYDVCILQKWQLHIFTVWTTHVFHTTMYEKSAVHTTRLARSLRLLAGHRHSSSQKLHICVDCYLHIIFSSGVSHLQLAVVGRGLNH